MQVLVEQRRFGEAIKLLGPVLASGRGNQATLHLMADLHARNGDPVQAESWFRRAIKADPRQLAPYLHLAEMLGDNDKPAEAEKVLRKALKVAPGSPLLHGHLGAVLQELKRYPEARDEMQRSLELNPNNPKIHNNLAVVCHRLGRPSEALAGYEHALRLDPDYLEARRNLARHWRHMGQPERAEGLYKAIIGDHPDSFADARELAEYYLQTERMDEASELYQRFEHSTDPRVLTRVGTTLQEIGRIARGNQALRTALSLNPKAGAAWAHLVMGMDRADLETSIPLIRRAYDEETGDDELNQQFLAMALGRAYEKLKQPIEAFDYLRQAHTLRRRGYDYKTSEERARFTALKETFSAENAAQWRDGGCADPTPIFIVGMPRSGTTLVEQIISSHPQVHGAGELTTLAQLAERCVRETDARWPTGFATLSDAQRRQVGEEYVQAVRDHSEDARFITDKLPHNFLRVGFIRAVLPNARIIHCRRDARDNCWSIFKQMFAGYHPYSHNLTELAEYHLMYQDLMAHWREVYPGEFLEVDYEALVADPETHVRRLLEHCGLDWHDDCLRFHEQDRNIRTASKLQVRQPMYRTSVAAWEPFREQLQPLLKVLDSQAAVGST